MWWVTTSYLLQVISIYSAYFHLVCVYFLFCCLSSLFLLWDLKMLLDDVVNVSVIWFGLHLLLEAGSHVRWCLLTRLQLWFTGLLVFSHTSGLKKVLKNDVHGRVPDGTYFLREHCREGGASSVWCNVIQKLLTVPLMLWQK